MDVCINRLAAWALEAHTRVWSAKKKKNVKQRNTAYNMKYIKNAEETAW